MLNWLKNKLINGRIKQKNTHLTMELRKLNPNEVAYVVIFAIEFTESFRDLEEGFFISRAILNPSDLASTEAQALYYQLEDLLFENMNQNNHIMKSTKNLIGGAETKEKLITKLAIINTSVYLLMSRVSFVFNKSNREQLFEVRDKLLNSLQYIDDATNILKKEHALFNNEKHEGYYNSIKISAKNYCYTYAI